VSSLAGIVLGAGSSTRLGRPKQTLPLGGRTVLGHALAAAEASQLDPVCLVVGSAADEALAAVSVRRAVVAYNGSYGTGCASSLLAGLAAVGSCDGIVILLGDMPTLATATIDAVAAAWATEPSWAAVTRYSGGALGHPFVFSDAAFGALRALHGDKAVWRFVDVEAEDRVRRIDVDEDLPHDIDTWDDYVAVAAEMGFPPIAP
jgi:molybdenum cofactor cytidylyltransferase